VGTPASEVIFLQVILFANTATFFYLLFGLVSRSFQEGDSGKEISKRQCCLKRWIRYAILGLS